MIEYSGRIQAFEFANEFGPNADVFTFGGTPPTSLETVPFELFIATVEHPLGEGFRSVHYGNVYNNMLSRCVVDIDNNDTDFVGYDNISILTIPGQASIPKLSFFDYSIQKYRHIPQTIETDLLPFDKFSGTERSSSSRDITHAFWPTGETTVTVSTRLEIPSADRQRAEGFFINMDFGYEAAIDEIDLTGVSANSFRGNLTISEWDETLNGGAGDWVVFHVHPMATSGAAQNIVLPSQMITTKVRFHFEEADDGTNTYIKNIHFTGPTPISMPLVSQPITWALIVPRQPRHTSFIDVVREAPIALVTAGGPIDQQELAFGQQVSVAGRDNQVISGRIKFLPKEI